METNLTSNVSVVIESCILPYEITENQWAFYESFLWWLEGFGAVLMGLIGLFFNLTTICVLLGSELAASFFNWLLVSLSVFDIFFLLNGILEAFRNHFGSTNIHTYMFAVFLFPFRSIVMCCSIYTTVMLALERYNALVNPISHHGTGGLRSGRQTFIGYFQTHRIRLFKYIGPILILSTVIYIPKWFEVGIQTNKVCAKTNNDTNNDGCHFEYDIIVTGLRSNNHYNLWYLNIFNLLITAALPLISLTYLNVNIYLKFKEYLQRQPVAKAGSSNIIEAQEKAKKREKDMIQQTMILFSVVFLFFVFHILRIILNVEEFYSLHRRETSKEVGCGWLQYWAILASPISHLLLQINSSINFLIYCYFNKSFRDKLTLWLGRIFLVICKSRRNTGDTVNLNGEPLARLTNAKHITIPDTIPQEQI